MANSTEDSINIKIIHHGATHTLPFSQDATISDLSEHISTALSIPISNQKFMISKLGLLKPPFKDPKLPLSTLTDKKISLLGSTAAQVTSLDKTAKDNALQPNRLQQRRPPTVTAYKTHDWKREAEEAQYTFTTLRALPYLPNPSRSHAFLQRLKDDAGIKATMRKHKFTVPLLTEMNPIEHTTSTHEGTSRTLGLNRNGGEVIELRLRTDAYDGYRDYKTIRKTLCHELAHNVHGPHDRNFWELCKQIEREVEGSDWRSGGHSLGNGGDEFYGGEEVDDHGGWTGGDFVLGSSSAASGSSAGAGVGASAGGGGLSRREVLAQAAEERIRRQQEQQRQQQRKDAAGEGEGGAGSSV